MAIQMRDAIIASPNQKYVTPPTKIESKTPFKIDTAISRLYSHLKFDLLICCRVNPLIIIVKVCVPATPPMLATIGIRIAK